MPRNSRGAQVIPHYDDIRAILASIPKRSTTVLTNSHKAPWTRDGFGSSLKKAKIAAGLHDRDLHFQAPRHRSAWEEEHVAG